MEADYTKRELDSKFQDVTKHLLEQDDVLKRIEIKITWTNGKIADVQAWRNYMSGGLAVLTTLVIPIIIYLVTRTIK